MSKYSQVFPPRNGLGACRRWSALLVLSAAATAAATPQPSAQHHSADSAAKSLDDLGFKLAVHDGELLVGGLFRYADEIFTGYAARFDGTTWHSVGGNGAGHFQGPVSTFLSHGDDLFVGGIGDSGPGMAGASIARWDGAAWHVLDGLLAAPGEEFAMVNALAIYEGKLVAAGTFTTAGTPPARNIAQWDGSAWTALDVGVDRNVDHLFVHDDDLLVSSNGVNSPDFGSWRWDGAAWQAALGTASGYANPYVFQRFDGELVAGGEFYDEEGVRFPMARWTGTVWEQYPQSPDVCGVNDLETYRGELVMVCTGNLTKLYALRDGVWSTFGTANGGAEDLVVYNERLIVTGGFTTIDGVAAERIASWDGRAWHADMPRNLPIFSAGFEP